MESDVQLVVKHHRPYLDTPAAPLTEYAMRSKHSIALSPLERAHVRRVKELGCSVCEAPGPSDAHHIRQGCHFTTIALCKDCHQGPRLGWHGEKLAWKVRKMDELDALNVTLRRLS